MIKRIHILDCGSLEFDLSYFTWKLNIGKLYRFPVWCTYVEHSEGDILIDSGYNLKNAMKYYAWENPIQTAEQQLENQLKMIGKRPEDIKYVILSHLHFDHCGNNHIFKNAIFYVQKEEMRHAYVPDPFEAIGYSRETFDVPGLQYELINGDKQNFFEGISLVTAPGHSAGLQVPVIDSKEFGKIIIESDVINTRLNLEKKIVGGIHWDSVKSYESMIKIMELQKTTKGVLFFAHDAEWFSSVKKGKDFYT
ncbi:MAG: N-acyl homoserine lactonase family protein [Candidatus Caldarchaeum sp.]|nr:N-acyl homoserine lactonase family protein [Candidatus Caldarchaeum sp.]MDW8436253.1 N-acyl homoserine lactonase family protein [Candidatus Caldarchaeum sp.]